MPLRQTIGAVLRSGLQFERRVRGHWQRIHNRGDRVVVDGRGVRCEWMWVTSLDYCRSVRGSGKRLLRAAVREWPIALASAPIAPIDGAPEVSFIIGHRGRGRLPLLLLTLRSIAAQRDARVECIVVEQSPAPEIAGELPSWVRYVHQPVGADVPYGRSATFNLGARLAAAPVLVLHDNDMLVPERYAAEVLKNTRAGADAVDVKRFIFYLSREATHAVIAHGALSGDEEVLDVVQNLHGGSLGVSKSAYEGIGGFDESFIGWGGEDVEFWERAETRPSTRSGYLPIIHLWHEPQPEKARPHDAPAITRYYELAKVPPRERIARLTGAVSDHG